MRVNRKPNKQIACLVFGLTQCKGGKPDLITQMLKVRFYHIHDDFNVSYVVIEFNVNLNTCTNTIY